MNLYQLQASWDDERAHARVLRYRIRPSVNRQHPGGGIMPQAALVRPAPTPPQADGMEKLVRQDCRWLPVLIPLFALALAGLAAIGA